MLKATILDLRYRMKQVLSAIDRGETITVLHRGKPKAIMLPIRKKQEFDLRTHPAFGMWKDRADMRDVPAYVRRLREGRTFPVPSSRSARRSRRRDI